MMLFSKKVDDAALLEDAHLPDTYQYERALRLGCSQSGIFFALRRLATTLKKILSPPKIALSLEPSFLQTIKRLKTAGKCIVY